MADLKSTVRTCKIVVAGFSHVGKTNISQSLITGHFDPRSPSTIAGGSDEWKSTVDGVDVHFQICDTPGQERFRSVTKAYLTRANGVVLVFDITDRKSFDEILGWLSDVRSLCDPEVPILLVGNKSDDAEHRTVTATEAEEFSKRHNLIYQETSAKTGNGIREGFLSLGRKYWGK
jgi:small GTP-binding protein